MTERNKMELRRELIETLEIQITKVERIVKFEAEKALALIAFNGILLERVSSNSNEIQILGVLYPFNMEITITDKGTLSSLLFISTALALYNAISKTVGALLSVKELYEDVPSEKKYLDYKYDKLSRIYVNLRALMERRSRLNKVAISCTAIAILILLF